MATARNNKRNHSEQKTEQQQRCKALGHAQKANPKMTF